MRVRILPTAQFGVLQLPENLIYFLHEMNESNVGERHERDPFCYSKVSEKERDASSYGLVF